MEEAQDRKVGFGMGGEVEVLSHREIRLVNADRAEVFGETIAKPPLGLTDIDQLASRAADAVDEVGGGAGEPLSDLEGLLGSLKGVEVCGCRR